MWGVCSKYNVVRRGKRQKRAAVELRSTVNVLSCSVRWFDYRRRQKKERLSTPVIDCSTPRSRSDSHASRVRNRMNRSRLCRRPLSDATEPPAQKFQSLFLSPTFSSPPVVHPPSRPSSTTAMPTAISSESASHAAALDKVRAQSPNANAKFIVEPLIPSGALNEADYPYV